MLYALNKPPGSHVAAGLAEHLSGGTASLTRLSNAISEEDHVTIRTVMRTLAISQEMHYAETFSYTVDLSQLSRLESAIPNGVRALVPVANDRGWIGFVLHEATGASCVLSYGMTGTIGWPAGGMICL